MSFSRCLWCVCLPSDPGRAELRSGNVTCLLALVPRMVRFPAVRPVYLPLRFSIRSAKPTLVLFSTCKQLSFPFTGRCPASFLVKACFVLTPATCHWGGSCVSSPASIPWCHGWFASPSSPVGSGSTTKRLNTRSCNTYIVVLDTYSNPAKRPGHGGFRCCCVVCPVVSRHIGHWGMVGSF